MRLSTRFALATIALVVLTATVIGVLNYRVFEAAGVPAAVDRFEMGEPWSADRTGGGSATEGMF